MNFTLAPFRQNGFIERLDGEIEVTRRNIRCRYLLAGDMSRVRWPAPQAAGSRKFGLWESTCFEFFLGQQRSRAYYEFNLSPSGNWNSFSFSDLHADMAQTDVLILHSIDVAEPTASCRQVTADIDVNAAGSLAGRVDVGVSSVIEDIDGNYHYYALSHPAAGPDFHRREIHLISFEI